MQQPPVAPESSTPSENIYSQFAKPRTAHEQYRDFTIFLIIAFVILIITGVTAIIISGFAIQAKVNSSNDVNNIITILVNSFMLTGNCWTCNAKTGDLTFISKYVENVPDFSDAGTTPQFPISRGNKPIIPNLVAFNNLAFINGLDLTSSTADTTQLFFGNMSKLAVGGVTGLPTHSRSALIINTFNGDIVNENSRCVSFTHARIYIVYNYNNLLNITNFNLCLCPPNTLYPQHEFCHQFA